jgi:hypothetical protein
MRARSVRSCVWPFLMLLLGCRGEAVSTPASSAPLPVSATPPVASAPLAIGAGASAVPSAAPSASAPASATPVSPEQSELQLLGPDGTPLAQTEERPSVGSERFKQRMQLLADSIRTGDAERARSTFFPLVAYAQVKDVQKPERDYRYRLLSHFDRDVRNYHKLLGKDAGSAQFLGVDVPEARVQWMKPGKEGNRLGYFRVLRSTLRFRLANGAERTFELTSMISWRGEWYVVHLHGFE